MFFQRLEGWIQIGYALEAAAVGLVRVSPVESGNIKRLDPSQQMRGILEGRIGTHLSVRCLGLWDEVPTESDRGLDGGLMDLNCPFIRRHRMLGEVGVIRDVGREHLVVAPGALQRAVLSLLCVPDDEESDLLAELGRAAVAVQLVVSSPRQTLLQQFILPHALYLDASVLLPMIVDGHPFRPVYVDAMSRLREASNQFGHTLTVSVSDGFLNEVVSHRRLAFELVEELGLEEAEELRRHITFYGAANTNVYVAAFASRVGRVPKDRVRFRDFMKKTAPYDSEGALRKYLHGIGIETVSLDYRDEENREFTLIFGQLKEGYEEQEKPYQRRKDTVLIEHEAQQLTRLRIDQHEHKRTLFVTADMQLLRLLQRKERLRDVLGSLISGIGLVGLVDMVVGFSADRRSLARLVWGAARDDVHEALRNFLVARALQHYDVAMAMTMHEVIAEVVSAGASEARDRYLELARPETVEDYARTADFLDRLETQFFNKMRDWIEREQKGHG